MCIRDRPRTGRPRPGRPHLVPRGEPVLRGTRPGHRLLAARCGLGPAVRLPAPPGRPDGGRAVLVPVRGRRGLADRRPLPLPPASLPRRGRDRPLLEAPGPDPAPRRSPAASAADPGTPRRGPRGLGHLDVPAHHHPGPHRPHRRSGRGRPPPVPAPRATAPGPHGTAPQGAPRPGGGLHPRAADRGRRRAERTAQPGAPDGRGERVGPRSTQAAPPDAGSP